MKDKTLKMAGILYSISVIIFFSLTQGGIANIVITLITLLLLGAYVLKARRYLMRYVGFIIILLVFLGVNIAHLYTKNINMLMWSMLFGGTVFFWWIVSSVWEKNKYL